MKYRIIKEKYLLIDGNIKDKYVVQKKIIWWSDLYEMINIGGATARVAYETEYSAREHILKLCDSDILIKKEVI